MTYNRLESLDAVLTRLASMPGAAALELVVAQSEAEGDTTARGMVAALLGRYASRGDFASTTQVVTPHLPLDTSFSVDRVQHGSKKNAMNNLLRGLEVAFTGHDAADAGGAARPATGAAAATTAAAATLGGTPAQRVVVIEDDAVVSCDVLEYFEAAGTAMDAGATAAGIATAYTMFRPGLVMGNRDVSVAAAIAGDAGLGHGESIPGDVSGADGGGEDDDDDDDGNKHYGAGGAGGDDDDDDERGDGRARIAPHEPDGGAGDDGDRDDGEPAEGNSKRTGFRRGGGHDDGGGGDDGARGDGSIAVVDDDAARELAALDDDHEVADFGDATLARELPFQPRTVFKTWAWMLDRATFDALHADMRGMVEWGRREGAGGAAHGVGAGAASAGAAATAAAAAGAVRGGGGEPTTAAATTTDDDALAFLYPALRPCEFCENDCYDHLIEWGLQGRTYIAPDVPRVTQRAGAGMTYSANPSNAIYGGYVRRNAWTLRGAGPFRLVDWFPTMGASGRVRGGLGAALFVWSVITEPGVLALVACGLSALWCIRQCAAHRRRAWERPSPSKKGRYAV